MKTRREHIVPLSMQILEGLGRKQSGFIFTGNSKNGSLPIVTIRAALRRTGYKCAIHGFRSSFRDYCGDVLGVDRELAEQCLAHAVGNATVQAYRRGTALAKR